MPSSDVGVAPHPMEEFGIGTIAKGENSEKSKEQVYRERRSQAEGMKLQGVGVTQE